MDFYSENYLIYLSLLSKYNKETNANKKKKLVEQMESLRIGLRPIVIVK